MFVECLIERDGPTTVQWGGFTYTFEKNTLGDSVCDVNNEGDARRFLELSTLYRKYKHQTVDGVASESNAGPQESPGPDLPAAYVVIAYPAPAVNEEPMGYTVRLVDIGGPDVTLDCDVDVFIALSDESGREVDRLTLSIFPGESAVDLPIPGDRDKPFTLKIVDVVIPLATPDSPTIDFTSGARDYGVSVTFEPKVKESGNKTDQGGGNPPKRSEVEQKIMALLETPLEGGKQRTQKVIAEEVGLSRPRVANIIKEVREREKE